MAMVITLLDHIAETSFGLTESRWRRLQPFLRQETSVARKAGTNCLYMQRSFDRFLFQPVSHCFLLARTKMRKLAEGPTESFSVEAQQKVSPFS